MEKLTKSDQLRLAIAICTLRFKPKDQSITAYVLELRDRFRSYGPCYSDDVSWKSLALELEGENTRLREQLDAEKIRYLTLASKGDSSVPIIGSSSGSNLVNGKSKKSRNKVAASNLNHGAWEMDVLPCSEYAQNDDRLVSTNIFPAMDAFSRLLSLEASAVPQGLFVSTTCRSVEAIADSLDSLFSSTTIHKKNYKKHLEILNIALQYVLVHGIPLLARFSKTRKRKRKRDVTDSESQEDPLDRFFALLQSRIFSRIIATTCRLSRVYFRGLLLSNADASHADGQASRATDGFQEAPGDLRAGVMLLFEGNARLLFTDPPSFGGITDQIFAIKLSELHASLALETVSELDKVIFGNPVNSSAVPPSNVPGSCHSVTDGRPEDAFKGSSDIKSSVHQRVERLAIKDAVWYLCNVMHILLGGSNAAFTDDRAESGESPGGVNIKGIQACTILLEAAQDILFRLVIRYRKEIMNDKANSADSSLGVNSHATEHELKRRMAQENSIGVDKFGDGGQQTGETTVSDVDEMKGGKDEERGSCAKTVEAYESAGMGQNAHPMIDDVTYNMLMGVVERFVLCKCLS